MNVRFHLPQDQEQYAQRVLALLLQAAVPQAAAQLVQIAREEQRADESRGA